MWSATPKLIFVLALAINGIIWSNSRYGQVSSLSSLSSRTQYTRRSIPQLILGVADNALSPLEDEVRIIFLRATIRNLWFNLPLLEMLSHCGPSRPAMRSR